MIVPTGDIIKSGAGGVFGEMTASVRVLFRFSLQSCSPLGVPGRCFLSWYTISGLMFSLLRARMCCHPQGVNGLVGLSEDFVLP